MTIEKSSTEAQQPGLTRRQLATGAAWATPLLLHPPQFRHTQPAPVTLPVANTVFRDHHL